MNIEIVKKKTLLVESLRHQKKMNCLNCEKKKYKILVLNKHHSCGKSIPKGCQNFDTSMTSFRHHQDLQIEIHFFFVRMLSNLWIEN